MAPICARPFQLVHMTFRRFCSGYAQAGSGQSGNRLGSKEEMVILEFRFGPCSGCVTSAVPAASELTKGHKAGRRWRMVTARIDER